MTDQIREAADRILNAPTIPEEVRSAALRIITLATRLEAAGAPRKLPSEEPQFPFESLPLVRTTQRYNKSLERLHELDASMPELILLKKYGLSEQLARILYRADKINLSFCKINRLVEIAKTPFSKFKKENPIPRIGVNYHSELIRSLNELAAAYGRGELESTIELVETEVN